MLGQKIKELRLALSWGQVDLAKRLGVAKQTVSNWENDNIQPSVDMLVRLADLFHVTTDYLLGREDISRISIEGLPVSVVAHLSLLIQDYNELSKK